MIRHEKPITFLFINLQINIYTNNCLLENKYLFIF